MRDNAVGLSGLEFSLSLQSRSLRSCFEGPEPPVLFNTHVNKTARMSCRLIIGVLHPFFSRRSERTGGGSLAACLREEKKKEKKTKKLPFPRV